MKNLLSIFILTVNSIIGFSQSNELIQGLYLDDRDTIKFHQDSITFSIMSNGGLIYPMEGVGHFTQNEDILIVRTGRNYKKLINGKAYRELGDREYIEYKTLVFKINRIANDSLNLTLIGLIENADFREKKTVRKFKRDQKRFRFRERQLTREN